MYLHYDSKIICRYFSSHRTHTNTSSTSLSVIMQIHLTLQMYPQFHFFQCCRYILSKKCILNFTFFNVADTFRQKNVSSSSLFSMLQIHSVKKIYPQLHFFQCCRYFLPKHSNKCILNFTFFNVADTFCQNTAINVSSTSLFSLLQIPFAHTRYKLKFNLIGI